MKVKINRYCKEDNRWLCGHVGHYYSKTRHTKKIAIKTKGEYRSYIFNNVNGRLMSYDNENNTYLEISKIHRNSKPIVESFYESNISESLKVNGGIYDSYFFVAFADKSLHFDIRDFKSSQLKENNYTDYLKYMKKLDEVFFDNNVSIFTHILNSGVMIENSIDNVISDKENKKKGFVVSNLQTIAKLLPEFDISELKHLQNSKIQSIRDKKYDVAANYREKEVEYIRSILKSC